MVRALVVLILLSVPVQAQRSRAVRPYPLDTPANWLRHRAIALDDTPRLLRLTANARVVAFGDVTHGTHETYAARLRVIPELIDNAGFRIIAVEGPYAQYAALDEYLRTGTGDPAALLRNDPYWFWNTQETLDLILWARARNASGISPPIRIAGIDATQSTATAARVIAALRRVDPSLAAFAELQYGCLPQCDAAIREVRSRIETRRALFASADEFEETRHAARVIEQSVAVDADFMGARDAMLAENLAWLSERGKVVVWGHNEHFSRTAYQLAGPRVYRSAGADLTASLGDAYFVIGSVVLEGAFYNVQLGARPLVGVQPIGAPLADDWATVLDEVGLTSVIVPLFAPLPDWMAVPRRIRFAGSSGSMLVTAPQTLAAKFDAVLYIRTSTPSHLRHFPLF